jgi:hypothetical protein
MGSSEVGHNAPNQWRLGRSDAGAPDAVGGTPTSEISQKWFLFLGCMMYAVWIHYII